MKFSPLFDNAITDAIVQAAAFSLRFAAERHRRASAEAHTWEPGQFVAKGRGTIPTPESVAAVAEAERLELAAAYLVARARDPIDPASRVCAREEGDYDLGEILARALERQEKRRSEAREEHRDRREPSSAALEAGAQAIQQARGRFIDDFRPLAGAVWAAMWKATQDEFLQDVLR